ncbi:MAG: RecX family transcriptional regulator [Candidatus Omnitrophica bacterium]|nr:RecX family transcriptional regulator [Candidatus Omnitrophota bacterium]MCM8776994.1 RecX family transcriptional regulator [Candidatus Omnitrophota bacterium]
MKNKKLYNRALKLLSRKGYSEAELREKISVDAKEDEVEEVIEECKKQRYLDDRTLAEYLVERNLKRTKGFWYIISTLEKRKIKEEVIEDVKNNFNFEDEYKKAEEFVRKNKRKKGISSILFSLKSKGFSYPVMNRIAGKYLKVGE